MNLTIADRGPRLRPATPADRHRFARAYVRRALAALPTDARSRDLAAQRDLPDADQLVRWPAVPRRVWDTGSLGPARRALWDAAYRAVYLFSLFAAEKAAWSSQWAVTEAAVEQAAPVPAPTRPYTPC